MCDCKQCRTLEREREYYSAVFLSLTNVPHPLRHFEVEGIDGPLPPVERNKSVGSCDPMQLPIAFV